MNIQVSVMVWTVICFLLLVLILKKLLFDPMLRMTDAREERVEAARKHRKEREEAEAAAKTAAGEAFQQESVQAKNNAERMIVQEQENTADLLAKAECEEQNERERYEKTLANEKEALSAEVSAEAERLAVLFVSRLT